MKEILPILVFAFIQLTPSVFFAQNKEYGKPQAAPLNPTKGMGVVGHNHVALQVESIEISAKFYRDIVGLEQIEVPDSLKTKRAWFNMGNFQMIHLLNGRTKPVENDRNGSHFSLFVASMDNAEAVMKANNIPFFKQIRFGGVKQIYFSDPDGYLIELNEKK